MGWCWKKWFPQEILEEVKIQRSLWEERYSEEVGRRERVEAARGVVEGLLGVERGRREKAEIALAEVKMEVKMERLLWEER